MQGNDEMTEPIAEDEGLREVILFEEDLYNGKFLHLMRRTVQLPDGRTTTREMLHHPGAAAMVVIDGDNRVVFERQWRAPMDAAFWEIPAGKIDPGEDPLETARRELQEETGIKASDWVARGTIHNAIGYSDEHIDIFLARGVVEGGARELDEHEFIDVHKFSLDEALAMTRDGRITDVKTIIGLNWAQQYLEGRLPQARVCKP